MEKSWSSEIISAIEEVSRVVIVKSGDNHEASSLIPTTPFLSICYLVLQVLGGFIYLFISLINHTLFSNIKVDSLFAIDDALSLADKIGPTMAVLRHDIHQNIRRLEVVLDSNPSLNSNLVEIFKTEINEGKAKKGPSCSKAFVWLTRALDFASALLQRVASEPGRNLEEAVEECYNITLKPWHGWISSAAFRVALKLVPDSKTFIDLLKAKDESYESHVEKMKIVVSMLVPFLEDIHCILRTTWTTSSPHEVNNQFAVSLCISPFPSPLLFIAISAATKPALLAMVGSVNLGWFLSSMKLSCGSGPPTMAPKTTCGFGSLEFSHLFPSSQEYFLPSHGIDALL
ncbi:glycolipid transfer protein 3-like [Senna tora]|uniref:Glycolipid transfer protein 3-like n=1 Tax=Senna tora TaxID=362788 RepID=A0A834WP13_9FABA|nr:glycolipid transfer protein 3-like [Senna tora]